MAEKDERAMNLMIEVAMSNLGKPYRWGGDTPMEGFDCSGFVIECLKSVGLLPERGDWTAHGLWNMFKDRQCDGPVRGGLEFTFSGGKATHVTICLDDWHQIGASGGTSETTSEEDAIGDGAYVKIRPARTGNNRAHVRLFDA